MARPTKFSQELGDLICERMANGESMRAICRDEGMPALSTTFRWISQDAVFQEQYTRAREIQTDVMAEEILAIADETENDTLTTDSGERPNNEWIARSRLRVDARKWLASKMAPKKYGDKLDVGIGGIADAPAVQVNIVRAKP